MRVTIKDVAKLAGVAPSTVTRVIQNKSTISDENKKTSPWGHGRVGLPSNLNARSLVSQSSQVIALVLPIDSDVFYQNPFFPTVLEGLPRLLQTMIMPSKSVRVKMKNGSSIISNNSSTEIV